MASVVQRLNSTINWINHYLVDGAISYIVSLLVIIIHWIVMY